MWRLIAITFGLLSLAFYQMSGGADYTPSEGSLQAHAAQKRLDRIAALQNPAPKTAETVTAAITQPVAEETVSRGTINLDTLPQVKITLASAAVPDAKTIQARKVNAATPETVAAIAKPVRDIRQVKGNRVNMRMGPGTKYNKIGQLTKGEQVIILQEPGNGWVKLRSVDTNRVGWMADFLLTAAN